MIGVFGTDPLSNRYLNSRINDIEKRLDKYLKVLDGLAVSAKMSQEIEEALLKYTKSLDKGMTIRMEEHILCLKHILKLREEVAALYKEVFKDDKERTGSTEPTYSH